MTQISSFWVSGADHSLFQSLLNFLNFARGLYALTLNSEQTIETDHDSPTDFVLENCKSNCEHFIVNNMLYWLSIFCMPHPSYWLLK